MNEKIVPWVDPQTNESLIQEGEYLVGKKSKYSIIDGIPNFVNQVDNTSEAQVQKSFGEKWTKSDFGQNDEEFNEKLKPVFLEMMGLNENDFSMFNDKIVLDVGIGSGSTARLWAPQSKEFHGIDLSKAVYRVKNALKSSVKNPILAQADLNNLPYKDNSFDMLLSIGVFHHTPNTKLALQNSLRKLKLGGSCLFYIYKKKSPIREFSDDYIRSQISELSYDEASKKMETITEFAKSLHEQNIKINIPNDVDILEIKKGEYDLQRFIYQYIFKCFWNESWGYDHSNLVNVDWYHPKYCWRHSEDEIKSWCKEFSLKIKHLKESDSGFACIVTKE